MSCVLVFQLGLIGKLCRMLSNSSNRSLSFFLLINRPYYLQDLLSEADPRHYMISLYGRQLNGMSFAGFGTPPLTTANLNELQEWTISNTRAHPWHMHVSQYPMRVSPKELVIKNSLNLSHRRLAFACASLG